MSSAHAGPAGHHELAPVRPGEDLDWAALEDYLKARLRELDGPMTVLQFPNGSANLTYQLVIGGTRLVVRRPPFGRLAPGAHDMRREYRVLSRLYHCYPRAPRALLYGDDESVIGSRFFVSEYRSGVVVWDRIPVMQQLYDRYLRNETTDPRMAGRGARVQPPGQRALGLLGAGK
jgi:aminoglycoside phosphotransferase (APT) family kinase protein